MAFTIRAFTGGFLLGYWFSLLVWLGTVEFLLVLKCLLVWVKVQVVAAGGLRLLSFGCSMVVRLRLFWGCRVY